LSIAIEIGDRTLQGIAFGGLGNVYRYLGKNEQAIDYYQQQLTIAQEIDDRAGEGFGTEQYRHCLPFTRRI
jgi:tetratricopeptide (TPR) repeat protein